MKFYHTHKKRTPAGLALANARFPRTRNVPRSYYCTAQSPKKTTGERTKKIKKVYVTGFFFMRHLLKSDLKLQTQVFCAIQGVSQDFAGGRLNEKRNETNMEKMKEILRYKKCQGREFVGARRFCIYSKFFLLKKSVLSCGAS